MVGDALAGLGPPDGGEEPPGAAARPAEPARRALDLLMDVLADRGGLRHLAQQPGDPATRRF